MIHKFLENDIASYASLLAARKLKLSAPITLSPSSVIIVTTEKLDKLGLPLYSPDVRVVRKKSIPEVIVFIGSTAIVCNGNHSLINKTMLSLTMIDISQNYTSVYFDEADSNCYVNELQVSSDAQESQQRYQIDSGLEKSI